MKVRTTLLLPLALLATAACGGGDDGNDTAQPQVIAHRGASGTDGLAQKDASVSEGQDGGWEFPLQGRKHWGSPYGDGRPCRCAARRAGDG